MGKGGDDYVVVGYKYSLGMHHVPVHGPDDDSYMTVHEFLYGDETAWEGTIRSNVEGNTSVAIDKPNLHGGEKKEGGFVGTVDFEFGQDSQGLNSYLSAKSPAPISAHRGVFGSVMRSPYIAANNPYLKKPSWVLSRYSTALFGSYVKTPNEGMNPAHIMYECLTNSKWGLGYDREDMDVDSFTAAAVTLYQEDFGLCLVWAKQSTIFDFLQEVTDHIGAILSVNPFTGQFYLKLIREESTEGLVQIDSGNSKMVDRQAPSWGNTTNTIAVTYYNVDEKEKRSVTVHDSGNIRVQGRVVHRDTAYMGINNAELATRVAERDLRMLSVPLNKIELEVNRVGWTLRPGDIFDYSNPERGLEGIVLRVGNISLGTLTAGKITISCVQDVFSMPETSYYVEEPGGWVPADGEPVEPPRLMLVESPYWLLERKMSDADLEVLTDQDTFVGGIATRPTGLSYNYELWTRVGTEAYIRRSVGGWAPCYELTAEIGADEYTSYLQVTDLTDGDRLETPKLALLGDELVWIYAINSSLTQLTVYRAMIDTVQATHAVGTVVYAFQTFDSKDPTKYLSGETVDAKFLTVASGGTLAIEDANQQELITVGRQGRPYPPGGVYVNDGPYFNPEFEGGFELHWAHRDRLLQIEEVPTLWYATSIGPEPGTTYNLSLYGDDDGLLRTITGITDDNYVYALADELADRAKPPVGLTPIAVTNPDAETGDITGWGADPLAGSMGAYPGYLTVSPHSGTYCFMGNEVPLFQMPSGYIDLVDAGILAAELDSGTAYITITWWQNSLAGNDKGRVGLWFTRENGSAVSQVFSTATAPAVWTEYSMRVQVPYDSLGVRKVRIILEGERFSGDYCTVFFDDISLEYDLQSQANQYIRYVLESERDSLKSLQKYDVTVQRPVPNLAAYSRYKQTFEMRNSNNLGKVGTHNDYTVMLHLRDISNPSGSRVSPSVVGYSREDGLDIIVTDPTGTIRYPRIVHKIDNRITELIIFFKMPVCTAYATESDFNVYTGSGLEIANDTDAFDDDYACVCYFDEPNPKDLTANACPITIEEVNGGKIGSYQELSASPNVPADLGMTHDETNWWLFSTNQITKTDEFWSTTLQNTNPLGALSGAPNRIGDGFYYGGFLWIPAMRFVSCADYDTVTLCKFDPTTLAFIDEVDITPSGAAATSCCYKRKSYENEIAVVSYCHNNKIFLYDYDSAPNRGFKGVIHLSSPIEKPVGITMAGNFFLISSEQDSTTYKVAPDGTVLGAVYFDDSATFYRGLASHDNGVSPHSGDDAWILLDSGSGNQTIRKLERLYGMHFPGSDVADVNPNIGAYLKVELPADYDQGTLEVFYEPFDVKDRAIASWVNDAAAPSADQRVTLNTSSGVGLLGVEDPGNGRMLAGDLVYLPGVNYAAFRFEKDGDRQIAYGRGSGNDFNSTLPNTVSALTVDLPTGKTHLLIGVEDADAAEVFSGLVRAFRFSKVVRDDFYLKSEFNNENSPYYMFSDLTNLTSGVYYV